MRKTTIAAATPSFERQFFQDGKTPEVIAGIGSAQKQTPIKPAHKTRYANDYAQSCLGKPHSIVLVKTHTSNRICSYSKCVTILLIRSNANTSNITQW